MQSRGLKSLCLVSFPLHGHPIHYTLCTDMPVRLGSGSASGYSSRASGWRLSRTIQNFFSVPLRHPQRSIPSAQLLKTESAISISSSRAEIDARGDNFSLDDSVSTPSDESIEGVSSITSGFHTCFHFIFFRAGCGGIRFQAPACTSLRRKVYVFASRVGLVSLMTCPDRI